VDPGRALNVWDLRRAARRRLPRLVWEYVERGAEDEATLRMNRAALSAIHFAPRALVDVSARSQEITVLGIPFHSPFGIAPMSPLGLCRHEGDLALARAARQANVPFVLSSHADVPLERIAAEAGGAPWLQVYPTADRRSAEAHLERAQSAGCQVIVLTVDVPVRGNREYNERNGFAIPPKVSLSAMADGLLHPHWVVNVYLRSLLGGYLRGLLRKGREEMRLRRDLYDWRAVTWLRQRWPGKLVIKGILGADDARFAAEEGADAIIVSNHGGRQLDSAPATIDVLPEIVAAAGDRLEVFIDGGFRRGADIAKALALGADMVFVGRPVVYGLAAAGEAGAWRVLELLRSELDRVLALIGCNAVTELGPQHLRAPSAEAGRGPEAAHAQRRRLNAVA
jgi:isopentenyl diphosphate isomerase/L-lactate dehydrogenase-like FMN-dependent dehydrogenase